VIAEPSHEATGFNCSSCKQPVIKPFGSRPDEYLVCRDCVSRHPSVVKPVEEAPDMSDAFWRIALGEQK
jgi:DNA-directed RNA polymerase subunit RPC12/RpoP